MTTSTVQPSFLHSQVSRAHIKSYFSKSFDLNVPPLGDPENLEILSIPQIPLTSKMVERGTDISERLPFFIANAICAEDFMGVLQFKFDRVLLEKLNTLLDDALSELRFNTLWEPFKEKVDENFFLLRGAGITPAEHNEYCPDFAARFFMGDFIPREIYKKLPRELVIKAARLRKFCREIVELLCRSIDQSKVFPEISFLEASRIDQPNKNERVYGNLIIHPEIPDGFLKRGDKSSDNIIRNSTHIHNARNLLAALFRFIGGGLAVHNIEKEQWFRIIEGDLTVLVDYKYLPPHTAFSPMGSERNGYVLFCEEIANYGRGLTNLQ